MQEKVKHGRGRPTKARQFVYAFHRILLGRDPKEWGNPYNKSQGPRSEYVRGLVRRLCEPDIPFGEFYRLSALYMSLHGWEFKKVQQQLKLRGLGVTQAHKPTGKPYPSGQKQSKPAKPAEGLTNFQLSIIELENKERKNNGS